MTGATDVRGKIREWLLRRRNVRWKKEEKKYLVERCEGLDRAEDIEEVIRIASVFMWNNDERIRQAREFVNLGKWEELQRLQDFEPMEDVIFWAYVRVKTNNDVVVEWHNYFELCHDDIHLCRTLTEEDSAALLRTHQEDGVSFEN